MRAAGGYAIVALVVAGLAVAPASRAAEPDEALVRAGLEQRRLQHDEAALALFQQAYAQSQTPRSLAQIGFAEFALGRWVDAENSLQRASELTTDPWIARHRADLREALDTVRTHLGWLDVRSATPGAEGSIDGAPPVALPMASPMRLASGSHTLTVTAPDRMPLTQAILVAPGNHVVVVTELAPAPHTEPEPLAATPPAEPTGAPSEPTGAVAAPVGVIDAASPTEPTNTPSNALRTGAWISAGVAGALLVGGVVAHGAREDARYAYRRCLGGSPASACTGVADRFDRYTALAFVGYGAGAAVSLLATVLALASPGTASTPAAVSVACTPSAAGLDCLLEGRF